MLKKILAILLMFFTALAMAAVDVNKANDKELDAVKGIGPVTSKLIITERKKGDFKNWQDFIDRIKGIGEVRAAKLSAEGLTVNGDSYKATAAAKKEDKKEAKADKAAAKDEKKSDTKSDKKSAKEAKAEAKAEAKKEAASAKKEAASAKK